MAELCYQPLRSVGPGCSASAAAARDGPHRSATPVGSNVRAAHAAEALFRELSTLEARSRASACGDSIGSCCISGAAGRQARGPLRWQACREWCAPPQVCGATTELRALGALPHRRVARTAGPAAPAAGMTGWLDMWGEPGGVKAQVAPSHHRSAEVLGTGACTVALCCPGGRAVLALEHDRSNAFAEQAVGFPAWCRHRRRGVCIHPGMTIL